MEIIEKIPKGLLSDESGYPFTGISPPSWIEDLDVFFSGRNVQIIGTPLFRSVANLCRRIGDHDLYSQWLKNALASNPSPWWCAAFSTSLLVGYFSTGKSLLDAGSISLNLVYALSLAHKEQDFSKGKFWNALKQADGDVHKTLLEHKPFIDRAVKWREVAVHRLPPRVRVLTEGLPSKSPQEITMQDAKLGVPDDPEIDTFSTSMGKVKPNWIGPVDLVESFAVGFHKFAAVIASVIVTSIQVKALLEAPKTEAG